MKSLILWSAVAALCNTGTLGAQEFSRFTFDAGGGFSEPAGLDGHSLDSGFNLRAGTGLNFSPYAGVRADFGFDSMGINSAALANLSYGGGGIHIWSATLDPIVHLTPKRRFDVYVTGGGGWFHEYWHFSDTSVASAPADTSFFGFYPVPYNPNLVVSDYAVNKPGIDLGAGVGLWHKFGGKFFAEARYVRVYTGAHNTDYLPVTFGFSR